jgi:hypothetical protein
MLRGSFVRLPALGALAGITLIACGGSLGLPGSEIPLQEPSPYPPAQVKLAKPPPTGTSVFWRTDATDASKLLATDWDGRVAGSIQFTQPPTPVGPQSPDGSRLVVGSEIVSSKGQVVAYPVRYGDWADDNLHLCQVRAPDGGPPGVHEYRVSASEMRGLPSPAWLFLSTPGGATKRVAAVGEFNPHGNVDVLACSVLADRAVIGQTFVAHTFDVAVYQLSTGRLEYRLKPGGDVMRVVASHDGRFLAENDLACNGARIREMPAGRVVGTLPGRLVNALSWDGSRVATTGATPSAASIEDWRNNRSVWSTEAYFVQLVRPEGGDFLMSSPPYGQRHGLLIVRSDGTATQVSADSVASGGTGLSFAFGHNPNPSPSC